MLDFRAFGEIEMLVPLTEKIWVDPEEVAFVKDFGNGKCGLWLRGQSALDNFLLEFSGEDVAQHINDAINDLYEDQTGEEEDDENR